MKNISFYIILFLVLVSKTIEEPIFLNVSPADLVWPLAAFAFAWTFLRNREFRSLLVDSKAWFLVMVLFFWGAGVSVLSWKLNMPHGLTSQAFLKSLAVNNLKRLLIAGYFTMGIWAAFAVNRKTFQMVTWISTLLFSLVGLKAFFTGSPVWAMGGRRIISTVNDPNVAAWVCLIGLLMIWALVAQMTQGRRTQSLFLKVLVVLSAPVYILTLLMTGSRTGLAGLGVLGVVMIISLMRTGQRAVLMLSVLLFLGSGLIHFDHTVLEGKAYAQISGRLFSSTESSLYFRGLLRDAAFDMGMAHPLTGVGPGQFPNFSTPYYEALGEDITTEHFETTIAPKVPHNTYVTFFAERGVIGAGLFLFLIFLSLRSARSGPEYGFIGLVILYSLFFNIENIRFVWFFWGGLTLMRPLATITPKDPPAEQKSWVGNLFLLATLLLSVTVFMGTVGQLYRTGVEIDGQTVEITVGEGGLDMTLQMSGSSKDPLFIRFDGPEVRDVIIRNAYGLYFDHFDLQSGKYSLSLNSGSKEKKMYVMRLQSGERDIFVHGRIHPTLGLGTQRMDDIYVELFRMDVVESHNIYETVEYEKVSTKYIHKSTGINFENQINLVSSDLTRLEVAGRYEMTWTFKKTGIIEHPYLLMARAYDLRDSRRGHAKNLAQNIVFDPPLTELKIGETFTASWTFDTENRPYMMQYSFYYRDKDAEKTYQLYPKLVRQGYVQ